MTNLPLAITLLLPSIAADGGQGHADTLLGILGAGPDYVRRHLGAIDTALGAQSPGISNLTALIDEAEEVVSTSRPTVRRQHVISQVVLRRFVEVLPAGRVLARAKLATGQVEFIGTNGAGWVLDFVPVDSQATEDLWRQVESRLNPALEAAHSGTALRDVAHLKTLKDTVALHFIRNPQSLTVHNQSFAEALDKHIDEVAKTPLAAEAFRRKYGLEPAGRDAMRLGAEAAYEHMVTLHADGGLFRLSVQRLYEKVSDRFDSRGVEILAPASANKEFLIGDVPAITLKESTGEFGVAQGVAVDEADKIFMPLAPRLLVVIGTSDAARMIADDEVDHYNKMEVRAARDHVMHRPGASFAASITAWGRSARS